MKPIELTVTRNRELQRQLQKIQAEMLAARNCIGPDGDDPPAGTPPEVIQKWAILLEVEWNCCRAAENLGELVSRLKKRKTTV